MNTNEILSSPLAKQWQAIGISAHHGINVALFSLHSQQSCGIGEFIDLILLIDWCKEVGFDLIQLLPLNDTGAESSPYAAISAFALNPIHLSLSRLPHASDFEKIKSLCSFTRVDYPLVRQLKEQFLRSYFTAHSEEALLSKEYEKFLLSNPWLRGYALFKTIKQQMQWRSWEEWPQELRDLEERAIERVEKEHSREIEYHKFIQYLCFLQMQSVKNYAEEMAVFLKGDIPILINRDSADVWESRHLFLLDYSAGAPPDLYANEGQKWGFPLYNWPMMERHHYRWWRDRLSLAATLYHLYRLDHIVGFFRIFAIPIQSEAKDGFFYPNEKNVWIDHGRRILSSITQDIDMLPIGEDLGALAEGVAECLAELGICGTKVVRWERYWQTSQDFIPPSLYSPQSMTTVSTHDSDTLQGWWKNYPKEAKLYCLSRGWQYSSTLQADYLFEMLKESHRSSSLFHINLLQEYLALDPDLVRSPEEERINLPGTVSEQNWSYRIKPSLEEISSHRYLLEKIGEILYSP